jgi:hypothetical protein
MKLEGKGQKEKGKNGKWITPLSVLLGRLTDQQIPPVVADETSASTFKSVSITESRRLARVFAFCLLPFAFCLFSFAQDGDASEVKFAYQFENTRFYIPLIKIDLRPNGEGVLKFKRGESDELIDLKFKLFPETMARIRQLYETTNFLSSTENYQDKKDHSNLGWVTLLMSAGDRNREARFNYTPNTDINELADIFRAIATQHMDMFDIENAQQFQPLDVPKQLEILENDLRLVRIAEPKQLLPKLREIANGDQAPIIARNQAKRLIESIEKSKFKSPVKTAGSK